MGKKILITVVIVGSMALLAAAVMWFVRARHTSALSSCLNNLRQIDSAKMQWALDTMSTNMNPTWQDLAPYIGRTGQGNKPICPGGGMYTIETMTNLPTCSLASTNGYPNGYPHYLMP